MSRERALRRAEQEAARAADAATRVRRTARNSRRARLRSWLVTRPPSVRRRGTPGLLAAKRRRAVGLLALGFLVVQVLTWSVTADWASRLAVAVVSLFALPVIAVFVL